MTDTPESALSHVSLGTNDYARAVAFYDAILPTIGVYKIMEEGKARAYGRGFPEFWVQQPFDEKPAAPANGVHVAFLAKSRLDVDEFYKAGIEAGAKDAGEPGPRPMYGEPYYGCFLIDPDGHKIEAMFWDESIADSSAA